MTANAAWFAQSIYKVLVFIPALHATVFGAQTQVVMATLDNINPSRL